MDNNQTLKEELKVKANERINKGNAIERIQHRTIMKMYSRLEQDLEQQKYRIECKLKDLQIEREYYIYEIGDSA